MSQTIFFIGSLYSNNTQRYIYKQWSERNCTFVVARVYCYCWYECCTVCQILHDHRIDLKRWPSFSMSVHFSFAKDSVSTVRTRYRYTLHIKSRIVSQLLYRSIVALYHGTNKKKKTTNQNTWCYTGLTWRAPVLQSRFIKQNRYKNLTYSTQLTKVLGNLSHYRQENDEWFAPPPRRTHTHNRLHTFRTNKQKKSLIEPMEC